MKANTHNKGALYIAFGEKYVEQAQNSAKSLKRSSNFDITLFSDREPEDNIFDKVHIFEPTHNRAKVDLLLKSPYENTLYLDSDTLIVSDLGEIFEILEKFDIVATHDLSRKRSQWAERISEYKKIPYGFPEINGGILAFTKSPSAVNLLSNWTEKFYELQHLTRNQDQPALRIALWESSARIYILPPEFNVRNEKIRRKIIKRMKTPGNRDLMQPRIFHFHGCHEINFFRRVLRRFRPMRTI